MLPLTLMYHVTTLLVCSDRSSTEKLKFGNHFLQKLEDVVIKLLPISSKSLFLLGISLVLQFQKQLNYFLVH